MRLIVQLYPYVRVTRYVCGKECTVAMLLRLKTEGGRITPGPYSLIRASESYVDVEIASEIIPFEHKLVGVVPADGHKFKNYCYMFC